MFDLGQAAKRAGIDPDLLAHWVKIGLVSPTIQVNLGVPVGARVSSPEHWKFDTDAIADIRHQVRLAAKPANGGSRTDSREPRVNGARTTANTTTSAEFYSVADVAAMWKLSPDTIRRLFADEPGVITLGDGRASRGRRKRITLRIPKEILERVKRKRAKK